MGYDGPARRNSLSAVPRFIPQIHQPMEVQSVQFKTAVYDPGSLPRDDRPQIAMAGRSNVGKSTLINAVLKRKRLAHVSQTPGKTRAVQFYEVNDRYYLVDLPGYGFAKVSKKERESWGSLVHGYLESGSPIARLFLLLDIRRDPSPDDVQMKEWLDHTEIDWSVVLTKCDKLSNNKRSNQKRAIARSLDLDQGSLLEFSAESGMGLKELRNQIVSAVRECEERRSSS